MWTTVSRPSRFSPDGIERRLAGLDALPRGVWLAALVNNEGHPLQRVAAVAAWQQELLHGGSPFEDGPGCAGAAAATSDSTTSPPAGPAAFPRDLAAGFAASFRRLRLTEICRHQPAVVEQVLRTTLWHADLVARLSDRQPRAGALAQALASFEAQWVERGEEIREVLRLFESIEGIANFARWSELQGLLRSQAWQDILACRALVETMPRLAQLVRRLGRARPLPQEASQPAMLPRPSGIDQWVLRPREVALPGTPIEVEGIRRSSDLSQMLLLEALWASRRVAPARARRLKRLFAARLAEQALLTYQHRDHWVEARWEREPGLAQAPSPTLRPRLEAGPIVVCVDTSASMSGGPERVAKAIVVHAMRVAAAERRRCFVYAFSGARQVEELELAADLDGLQRLADFIGSSFHGGTDVVEPLERALARLHADGWRQADLLIASDGEFGPTRETVESVAQARRTLGLRVQGVLIGDRETRGMRSIVDDTFWVRDWRRYGGNHGQVDSPVHDRNLTGLYFPNMGARPGTEAGLSGGLGAAAPGASAADRG